MEVRLHKNATTTPARRQQIQASTKPVREIAREFGVSEDTVRRWRSRDNVSDRSHTRHRLDTTLSEAQGAIVIELRRTLGLPLDDLVVVTREFINPAASRSAIHRLLKRHGLSRLVTATSSDKRPVSVFKTYEPGFIHIDVKYLPQMADESHRRYLFVAIDRALRFVYVAFKADKSASAARSFLRELHHKCPVRIQKVLTDNGKEFTNRLFGVRRREASGSHEFDQLCSALGIEHRLTQPRTPQTNGMVERFNGRLSEVIASHHFNNADELETTLQRYVWLYNHHLGQKALGHRSPVQAMKDWYAERPDLFRKKPRNLRGPDN